MDITNFEKQQKIRQLIWDTSWISVMLGLSISVVWYTWTQIAGQLFDKAFLVLMLLFVTIGFCLTLTRPIDLFLRRTALKKYWIEDHGDVIKLFGSVPANDIRYVYRQVLNVRPGYMIDDDAYTKFGCTIAAVKASEADLEAKKALLSMGFKVDRIG